MSNAAMLNTALNPKPYCREHRTGAPAARDVDTPGPAGIEGVEKVGAGMMFL